MNFLRLFFFDIRLQVRQANEWAALLLFFLVVLLLLPFAIGPDADLLRRIGPGLVWLAALLMNLLALDKLFVADARDGTLDVLLLSALPLPLVIASKLAAQIAVLLAILVLVTIPAVLMLDLDRAVLPVLLISLLLGVPVLVLLGAMAGALTVALPRNPALLTLLLVPFYIPALVFAVSACDAAASGGTVLPHLFLLGAILAVLLPVAPFVIAAALRNAQG